VTHLGLRTKLTLSYAALFAVVLVIIGAVLYHLVVLRLDRVVNERLTQLAAGLWGHMKFGGGQPSLPEDPEDYFVRTAAQYFQLYDAQSGALIARSEESERMHSVLSPAEVKRLAQDLGFDEVTSGRVEFRFCSAVFRDPERHPYLLRVGLPLVQVQEARDELIKTLMLVLPAGVLLAWVVGWWMAGNALKPVQELRTAAHQIGISQLDHRLPLRGTRDELDGLAETFNQVFARLEDAVGNMKQFTASISHELRTPLTALQIETEMALMRPELPEEYRRVLASQLEEFQKLNRLINRLLELARAEAGEIQLATREFDLSTVLHSLVEQIEPIAASKDVSLQLRCSDRIRLAGDQHWLERAILNLVDNAIKFTPGGGRVRIEAAARNGSAVIEIFDTGIGIPQESLGHIFERFYQVDASRSKQMQGVGLGLAIAKWIVEAHRGTIEVMSETGAGSCFTILLPLPVASDLERGVDVKS
jgi:heavy metal sensor kinase